MADALKYKQKIIHKKYKRFAEDVQMRSFPN